MRILYIIFPLLCLIILFAFWTSYQIQNLCDELLVHCHNNVPSDLLSAWDDKKVWFAFVVNRELLKELEVTLHVWESCTVNSPQFLDAKQRCEQHLTNIKSAYGICFACAL